MNLKRILGLILGVFGIVLLVFGSYINGLVKEGRKKISDAQKGLDRGSSILSLTPITKQVGKTAMSGIQEKINAGEEGANYYAHLAR